MNKSSFFAFLVLSINATEENNKIEDILISSILASDLTLKVQDSENLKSTLRMNFRTYYLGWPSAIDINFMIIRQILTRYI